MAPTRAYALKCAEWWGDLPEVVIPPALHVATAVDSTGVEMARAHALEGTGGCGGLPITIDPPALYAAAIGDSTGGVDPVS